MTADASALAEQALYVSALAGRTLGLRWHDEAHGLSYCDGEVIAVASARADVALLDLTLQALLVRQGSLAARPMQRLVGRPGRARAYLACELARGVQAARDFLPRAVLGHLSLAELPEPTANVAASLVRAKTLGLVKTPPAWGVLMPLKVLAQRAPLAAAGGREAEAELPASALRTDAPRKPTKPEHELERSTVLDAFRALSAGFVGRVGRLIASLFDSQSAERSAASSTGGGELSASEGTWLGGNAARRVGSGQAKLAEAMAPPGSTLQASYPEWDERRGRYRHDFVRVAVVEPDPEAEPSPTRPAPSETLALRRALSRLALGYELRRYEANGDELDIDAVVQLRVDLASGHAPDPRIYRAPARTKRDRSALILVDITGSTAESVVDGGRVFDRQLDFALSLAQALHASGDRVALQAFHSWGPKIVRLVRLLDFDERPDLGLLERSRRVAPVGYSRLGAAIRHGARTLREHAGTPYRLLVVVSDAFAYDQGYEGNYAAADTRRALAEARGGNTAGVCPSVAVSTDESKLEQVFGGSCFLALPRLKGYEKALRLLFERALADVTRQVRLSRELIIADILGLSISATDDFRSDQPHQSSWHKRGWRLHRLLELSRGWLSSRSQMRRVPRGSPILS